VARWETAAAAPRPVDGSSGTGRPLLTVVGLLAACLGLVHLTREGLSVDGWPLGVPLAGLLPFLAGRWLLRRGGG
jgi:hypothetical protein